MTVRAPSVFSRCPSRLLAAALALASGAVLAQADYPNRPIRLVVPFSPGGAVDGPTRVVAQELGRRLKQQIIVDNKPGAGATIGSGEVAKAAPDGYTLLLASQTNAISASLYPKLPFAPIDDFVGISLLGREPGVLVVHPSTPWKSVADVIAAAKARPGELNYASSGNGSGQHLFMAQFASMAGIKLTHVPYRGSGQATTDLLAGTVPLSIPGTAGMVGHIKAGKLRAAGCQRGYAFAATARCADAGRSRPGGLFRLCLDGAAGAKGYAGGDRRAAATRTQGRAGHARGEAPFCRGRHRGGGLNRGRIRRLFPRRARPLGAHGEGYRRQDRLTEVANNESSDRRRALDRQAHL